MNCCFQEAGREETVILNITTTLVKQMFVLHYSCNFNRWTVCLYSSQKAKVPNCTAVSCMLAGNKQCVCVCTFVTSCTTCCEVFLLILCSF